MNLNFGDPDGASLSRRLSSNNPFRQFEAPRNRGSSVQLSNSAFEQWIEKNKALIEDSDEEREVFVRPSFPTSSRTGSDSDVNYGRYVYKFYLFCHRNSICVIYFSLLFSIHDFQYNDTGEK